MFFSYLSIKTFNYVTYVTLKKVSWLIKPKFYYADFVTKSATKSCTLSRTLIMKVCNTNHVTDFHDMCCGLSWFVHDKVLLQTLLPTFSVHCNGLNFIRVTQMDLSWNCHGLCCKHFDISRLFLSATFIIYVNEFPCGEVSAKVGVMEFGLYYVLSPFCCGWFCFLCVFFSTFIW